MKVVLIGKFVAVSAYIKKILEISPINKLKEHLKALEQKKSHPKVVDGNK